jgi:hypothetical protein
VSEGEYVTRLRAPRSMPASETNLLSRRMRVVIAGNEFKFNPCNFSIMLPARLNDRKLYKEDKTEGISMNRFADKSKETKFGANEVHAGADNVCNEQSERHKYFRHCHFSSGRVCTFDVEEENEEFDTTLLDRYIPARVGREEELLRELDGRGDDDLLLPWYSWISVSEPIREGFCGGLV